MVGTGSGVSSNVNALAVSGSNLYVGGQFTSASGVANTAYIAKWDGSNWSALGTGMNWHVFDLALAGDGTLYAGGAFTTAGGVVTDYIAKWNGSAWSDMGNGVNSTVKSLAVSGSNLYAGGQFTTAGGVANTAYIAKWDGNNWSALGTGMNSWVNELTVAGDGTLYAGGLFSTAGGVSARFIAKWDGSAWSGLGSGVSAAGISPSVNALALSGSTLYVGGLFYTAGAKFSPYAAYVSIPKTTTTTTLGSSLNPSKFGQQVTLTASVIPSSATGTVTFKDGGSDLGTSPLSGGSATYVNSALSIGSHSVTAVYAGDTNYSGSTSDPLTQTVNKADTTTAVISSLNPSIVGDSVTFTATVTPSVTGTVQFFDGAGSLGTGTLNGSSQTTLATAALSAGDHSITGVYSGNAAYNTSTSPTLTQTVNNPAVNISVATNPVGLTITADGNDYTAPQIFNWTVGSSHTLAVSSPQAGASGTRYAFGTWSDGGAQSHSITVPASPTTYTATFGTEYQLTTSAGANGSVLPVSGNWYSAGSTPTISATANGGYAFDVWTLASGSGPIANTASASTTVTMNGPNTVSASFKGQATNLSAAITGKSGTYNGLRTWSVTVTNNGSVTASGAKLDSFWISLSGRCQPTATTSFPVSLGDISPGGSQTGVVSVDFSGCVKLAKFNTSVGYSANSGAASGTTPMVGVGQ